MNIIYWYSIGILALAAVICIRRRALKYIAAFYKFVKLFIIRDFCYALFFQRFHWIRATRGQALLVACYAGVNGFCMGAGIRTLSDLLSRTGTMAAINLIPLLLGGRTNMIAEFLGISLHTYYQAHHWAGRVVVFQGLLHVALVVARGDPWTFDALQISGLSCASALALLLLLSLYFVRRAAYEVFLKLHFFLSLGATVALLTHLLPKGITQYIYPIVALALWTINSAVRLIRIIHYNTGSSKYHQSRQILVKQYKRPKNDAISAVSLDVDLARQVNIRGGHYFYIFFSDLGLRRKFQAHPYMVSWWDGSKVSFLIQPQEGISWDLTTRTSIRSVILDGPYGRDLQLKDYRTVLLLAKGIGIAGLLPYALSIIKEKATHMRSLVTRSVDLIWMLEENCQQEWIEPWIEGLKKEDPNRSILTVSCYSPKTVQLKIGPDKEEQWYKYYYGQMPNIPLRIKHINENHERSLVAVCGDNTFTDAVKKIQRKNMSTSSKVTFEEVEFKPQHNRADVWNQDWDTVFDQQLASYSEKSDRNISGSILQRTPKRVNLRSTSSKRATDKLAAIEEADEIAL